ncbi:MAG: metallophosphoesterase [Clostridia bacterium]|nr:metallophosphoesterase [Clostridia bacterium]
MKIYSISDLHLSINNPKPMDIFGGPWDNYIEDIVLDWKNKVKEEDIVLIAGDISWAMQTKDAKPDLDFIASLPGKKIIIRGNHDYWWKSITAVRNMCEDGLYALQNDFVRIGEYIFTGTRGWQVPEHEQLKTSEDEKLLNREYIRLELSLASAKQEQEKLKAQGEEVKIISLIHYPPFNSKRNKNKFTELFEKYGVLAVVYGHIHGKTSRSVLLTEINDIKYYLTSCDQINNKLVEINV